jgi:hypothetical protein
MRILVCGGRSFSDYALLRRTLDQLREMHSPPPDQIGTWLPPPGPMLIHDGASGADELAARCATVNFVRTEVYPAAWRR